MYRHWMGSKRPAGNDEWKRHHGERESGKSVLAAQDDDGLIRGLGILGTVVVQGLRQTSLKITKEELTSLLDSSLYNEKNDPADQGVI